MNKHYATPSLLTWCALALSACTAESLPTASSVKADLDSSIKHGDSSAQIEEQLRARSLLFSFDRYASRYQSIIRGKTQSARAVVIYINVNNDKQFLSCETHDSFTMP